MFYLDTEEEYDSQAYYFHSQLSVLTYGQGVGTGWDSELGHGVGSG